MADGCILWLWTEQGEPEESRLFAAAEDFEPQDGLPADPFWHYLLPNSHTTQAARADQPQNFGSLPEIESPNDPDREAMVRLGIQRFCTVPVRWPSSVPGEKPAGAVNFYRRSRQAFTGEEFELVKTLASLVLLLLDDLINHASFRLLRRVFDVIRAPVASPGLELPSLARLFVERTLDQVLECIRDTFNCLECSVYLQDSGAADGAIELVSTIWPWMNYRQPRRYKAGEGLTGYCAARNVPICIFDLGRFEEDLQHIRMKYPEIQWSLPFNLKEAARESLVGNKRDKLPPLSFLAAPIVDHGVSFGVLRCCVARSAPYYFNKRQLDLLCLVAGLIGEWCGGILRLTRAQEQRQWLQAYVRGISALNSRAHDAAMAHKPDLASLFPKALEAAGRAVPGSYGLAIHLVSRDGRELQFAKGSGRAWAEISSKEAYRRQASFPANDTSSPASAAFAGNAVVRKTDLPASGRPAFFPDAQAIVSAPISSGQKAYGVLTIAFASSGALSEHAVAVAELLGRQLGLYWFLGETIAELRKSKEDLEITVEIQQQAFENLNHQLKTPIFLAHRAARRLMARKNLADSIPEIPRLKGQIRRAEQVVTNIRMFYDLARGKPVHTNLTAVLPNKLLERVTDTVRGHTLFSLDPSRGVSFSVAPDFLAGLEKKNAVARIDLELLDQMLDDLLDNAEKYGDPNTTVTVGAGLVARGQYLFISVCNSGKNVPISPQAAKTLTERGHRGDIAIWQAREGSGIGLYIVSEILAAHRGKLEIYPTNVQGITEFRLVFPTGATEK